jgi:hypothetical protein
MIHFVKVKRGGKTYLVSLDAYLNSDADWGKPFLWVCGIITAISILTMVIKWI